MPLEQNTQVNQSRLDALQSPPNWPKKGVGEEDEPDADADADADADEDMEADAGKERRKESKKEKKNSKRDENRKKKVLFTLQIYLFTEQEETAKKKRMKEFRKRNSEHEYCDMVTDFQFVGSIHCDEASSAEGIHGRDGILQRGRAGERGERQRKEV
jgi:hypothetical protein